METSGAAELRPVALYLGGLRRPSLQRILLVWIAAAALAGRPFRPYQGRLADLLHRSPRTIRRAVQALEDGELIEVVRGGRGDPDELVLSGRLARRLRALKERA